MKGIPNKRLHQLPPYLFSEYNKKKEELMKQGIEVIDLGIGDPDLPTPRFIVDALIEELNHPANMRYSPYSGTLEFRLAVAQFYKKQFGVTLDPHNEILTLVGSKEGIAHLLLALVDEEDTVLLPDPGYPTYRMAAQLSMANVYSMPLLEEHGFRPDFQHIPLEILNRSKVAFLNYPNNPTGATVDLPFFEEAVRFFKSNEIMVVHDSAYNLVTFDEYKAPSILQVKGSKEVAVELGSLSKAFNMTGWRIGYIAGNERMIKQLSILKSHIDTSQFKPIQKAAAKALTSNHSMLILRNNIYKRRMLAIIKALDQIGIKAFLPKGGIFIWAKVPDGYSSESFCTTILEKTGVMITPGYAFGPSGEGYFRISISVSDEKLKEAMNRLGKIM